MYKYAATDSIFDGVSNIYLISIATAFLAVIMAFYCSNLVKDETEKQLQESINAVGEDNEEDNYINKATTKIENNEKQSENNLENTKDFLIKDYYQNVHVRRNSTSTNENSDTDYDTDELQVDGIVSKLKSKRVKDLEAQLTRDQLEEEKKIERKQLAAIFELLKKQEAELNMKEIDECELNAQLSLYR